MERIYTLERGKRFRIRDNYELKKVLDQPTSLNLITYCKVTKSSSGNLKLEGDGFSLNLKYNPKAVEPVIEFIEVTDSKLKSYWPNGVTRIVFEVKSKSIMGKNELILSALNN